MLNQNRKNNFHLRLLFALLLTSGFVSETYVMSINPWYLINHGALKSLIINAIREERVTKHVFSKAELKVAVKGAIMMSLVSLGMTFASGVIGSILKEYFINRRIRTRLIHDVQEEFEKQTIVNYEVLSDSQKSVVEIAINKGGSLLFTGETGSTKSIIMKAIADKEKRERGSSVYWVDSGIFGKGFPRYIDTFTAIIEDAKNKARQKRVSSYILLDECDMITAFTSPDVLSKIYQLEDNAEFKTHVRFLATTSRRGRLAPDIYRKGRFQEMELTKQGVEEATELPIVKYKFIQN